MKRIVFLVFLSMALLLLIIYARDFFACGGKAENIEMSFHGPKYNLNTESFNKTSSKLNSEVQSSRSLEPSIPLFSREEVRATKGQVIKMIADRPLEELIPLLEIESNGKVIYPYMRTAAMKGRLELLEYMLGRTPITEQRKLDDLLKYSANSGNIDVVRYLLSFGATEKVPPKESPEWLKSSIIERSIRHARNQDFTEALLQMGFSIDKSTVEHMKQQKWLNPKSRKIIEGLEQKGLL